MDRATKDAVPLERATTQSTRSGVSDGTSRAVCPRHRSTPGDGNLRTQPLLPARGRSGGRRRRHRRSGGQGGLEGRVGVLEVLGGEDRHPAEAGEDDCTREPLKSEHRADSRAACGTPMGRTVSG